MIFGIVSSYVNYLDTFLVAVTNSFASVGFMYVSLL